MWGKDKKPKILMVEDDLNNHDLFRKAFEESGFEVMICQTADGFFIHEVSQFQPDIISMDLMIGKDGKAAKKDGFEAIEELKYDQRTSKIPIMVLSNFFQDNQIKRSKILGAVDFINVQGQTLQKTAALFLLYLDNPRKYKPSHPFFREDD